MVRGDQIRPKREIHFWNPRFPDLLRPEYTYTVWRISLDGRLLLIEDRMPLEQKWFNVSDFVVVEAARTVLVGAV